MENNEEQQPRYCGNGTIKDLCHCEPNKIILAELPQCSICLTIGHPTKKHKCPCCNSKNHDRFVHKCSVCHFHGHMEGQCRQVFCDICFETGHEYSQCPNPIFCSICHSRSHNTNEHVCLVKKHSGDEYHWCGLCDNTVNT